MTDPLLSPDRVATSASGLGGVSAADAADILRGLGINRVVLRGIKALTAPEGTIAGRARTMRLLPDREDNKTPVNGPVNRGLYDSLQPGEFVVVDALGADDIGALGDMMFARIQARGAVGAVIDGGVRDIAITARKGFPVFARGTAPAAFMGSMRPWESDVPIQCGGVFVAPGDWIVADADGLVVVPAALADEVARRAAEKAPADAFSQALLAYGFPLDDAYPLPPHMRRFLSDFLKSGALPDRDAVALARKSHADESDVPN